MANRIKNSTATLNKDKTKPLKLNKMIFRHRFEMLWSCNKRLIYMLRRLL